MFRKPEEERRIRFERIRLKRWNKHAIWKYLILLIIIIVLLKFLRSL